MNPIPVSGPVLVVTVRPALIWSGGMVKMTLLATRPKGSVAALMVVVLHHHLSYRKTLWVFVPLVLIRNAHHYIDAIGPGPVGFTFVLHFVTSIQIVPPIRYVAIIMYVRCHVITMMIA